MRVLIADDDHEIVDLLSIYLKNEGYKVVQAYDGLEAWNQLQADSQIDLAILDVMMPEMEGIEVVEKMRANGMNIPVIIASAKTSDHDKIEGLIAGADDYVAKPFNPLEVIARVKSLVRRQSQYSDTQTQSVSEIEVGPLVINRDAHQVFTIDGHEIQLTVLEFGILYLLASNPGQVFSADDIFSEVWADETTGTAKTVMVHVSHLREKIAKATGGDKVVQTVWGVGYKIEA
ncbi:response regulator transcription factor [Hutsoniella sourekii]|uniref:response regulator transcription factor n=1 Tax=Hutsoniella sourekii TaxID=87650 RepID=UPI0004821237|nr:response regulator transcription factor [Hutsoniella sourekii]